MLRTRIIPTLLLKGSGLYKTVKFKNEVYIGDPINTVRIFNGKAVDELILLDIDASRDARAPNFELIAEIVSEAFIPLCYGGGVSDISQIDRLFKLGVEKVAINAAAIGAMDLVKEASAIFGNQSIVVGLDFRKSLFGRYERVVAGERDKSRLEPAQWAAKAEAAGAGELLVYSIDSDGSMKGYEIPLVKAIAEAVRIPVIACGGARDLNDMVEVVEHGQAASAAAGSFFVFQGKHKAVLITYPEEAALAAVFKS